MCFRRNWNEISLRTFALDAWSWSSLTKVGSEQPRDVSWQHIWSWVGSRDSFEFTQYHTQAVRRTWGTPMLLVIHSRSCSAHFIDAGDGRMDGWIGLSDVSDSTADEAWVRESLPSAIDGGPMYKCKCKPMPSELDINVKTNAVFDMPPYQSVWTRFWETRLMTYLSSVYTCGCKSSRFIFSASSSFLRISELFLAYGNTKKVSLLLLCAQSDYGIVITLHSTPNHIFVRLLYVWQAQSNSSKSNPLC